MCVAWGVVSCVRSDICYRGVIQIGRGTLRDTGRFRRKDVSSIQLLHPTGWATVAARRREVQGAVVALGLGLCVHPRAPLLVGDLDVCRPAGVGVHVALQVETHHDRQLGARVVQAAVVARVAGGVG